MEKTETKEEITPLNLLLKTFEGLKKNAPNLRDAKYLDGVLGVIESHLECEQEFIDQEVAKARREERIRVLEEVREIAHANCNWSTVERLDFELALLKKER